MHARTLSKRNGGEFPSASPFPLPSLLFDERAWIFALPAKEETVFLFCFVFFVLFFFVFFFLQRSEERRVGKGGRSRWSPYH